MTISSAFADAVESAGHRPEIAGEHFFPARLAWAAAHLLDADGAGLSLSSDVSLRAPLGSSDPASSAAERLQFTTGEGPCLDAFALQATIPADAAALATRWPVFAGEMLTRTPFRSILALPLPRLGALDVYFVDPQGCHRVDDQLAAAVIAEVLAALVGREFVAAVSLDGGRRRQSEQRRRDQVPIAMGMASVTLGVTFLDALALLRSRAFVDGRSLDDLAADMVAGSLSIASLRA
ncbi:hypothetical protein JL107_09985 [Nakamurella flavida]|uniref:ANTAR domain-containing protein n=1 Tax=Nakamurella flavida TaxID=363630 RepID=A0A939C5E0_9ACTN|nr:hypothetical protein [Nakamurella flavida]MBM9476774.1 hypothetical protein [Nakamurella flavida]MDP9778788.1 hypothetical protein [Nakamurella flavida]